ncbi:MAG: putative deacylase [Gammaproteobacteria bacterium]
MARTAVLSLLLGTISLPGVGAGAENAFAIGGQCVDAGTRARFPLRLTETFSGTVLETSVDVVHSSKAGPVLCLTGGVHGDEVDGIEVERQIQHRLNPASVQATVITVPLINVAAFESRSRYLLDRRDLNQSFPGAAGGSMAARVAHRLMRHVVEHCTLLIDVHAGSDRRSNLPQIRADMRDGKTAALAHELEPLVVLHSVPGAKTLRATAHGHGVAAVTIELGEANRLERLAIKTVVDSIEALLARLPQRRRDCRAVASGGGAPGTEAKGCATTMYFRASSWLRAPSGGLFLARETLGA